MIIGIPKEVKNNEFRVGMLPAGVEALVKAGHLVFVESMAGIGSGATDEDYRHSGAEILDTAEAVYAKAEMIIKVKEPLPQEYPLMRDGQIIFTYFHFAASQELTEAVINSKIIAIAYETIRTWDNKLPLLTPMSEVAGRMSVLEGAKYLEKPFNGCGVLLGGVPGVAPAKVTVIGGGVVGTNAAKMAAGLGADVTIMDINLERLRYLDDVMPKNVTTLMSNSHNLRNALAETDLLIGAVLVMGDKAPVLVTEEMIGSMKPGAVVVDVAVDQGGCIATTTATTHENPIFIKHGVVHYCVANMPGAFAQTSTTALTNATLPYALQIANKGYQQAALDSDEIKSGLNIVLGDVVLPEVAHLFGVPCVPVNEVLNEQVAI